MSVSSMMSGGASRSADRAICDAGHKSHAIDSGLPQVAHPAGLVFANGGDEHGVLRTAAPGTPLPALGDTVWLIPGHCDPTVNLYESYHVVKGDTLVEIWPVTARGRSR